MNGDTLSGYDVHFRVFREGAYILVPDLLREIRAAARQHDEGDKIEALEELYAFLTKCVAKSKAEDGHM